MKVLKKKSILFGVLPILILLFLISIGNVNGEEKIVKENGKGFLGVRVEKMSIDDRDEFGVKSGVLVVKVLKDTSAEKAGLKKYDVIRFFNSVKIHRPEDLTEEVRKSKPGSRVKLLIVRDGKEKGIKVTLGKLDKMGYGFKDFGENIIRSFGRGAFLGVRLQSLDNDLASYFGIKKDGGALVIKSDKGSPAEKAGIKSGDVIIMVDKEKIRNGDDLLKTIKKYKPGNKVKLTILRHKKRISLIAVLDKGKWEGFMNIVRFPEKGIFHIDAPVFDKDEIMIWKDKQGEELRKRMIELKEQLKDENIMLKKEMGKELKEKILNLKERLADEKSRMKMEKERVKERKQENIFIFNSSFNIKTGGNGYKCSRFSNYKNYYSILNKFIIIFFIRS